MDHAPSQSRASTKFRRTAMHLGIVLSNIIAIERANGHKTGEMTFYLLVYKSQSCTFDDSQSTYPPQDHELVP
jgi:hypothetical protein